MKRCWSSRKKKISVIHFSHFDIERIWITIFVIYENGIVFFIDVAACSCCCCPLNYYYETLKFERKAEISKTFAIFVFFCRNWIWSKHLLELVSSQTEKNRDFWFLPFLCWNETMRNRRKRIKTRKIAWNKCKANWNRIR